MSTTDLVHRRAIVPRGAVEHAGVLGADESGARVELVWPAVRALTPTSSATGWSLHAIGAGDTVLLTLSAAAERLAAAMWRGGLKATFPGLG